LSCLVTNYITPKCSSLSARYITRKCPYLSSRYITPMCSYPSTNYITPKCVYLLLTKPRQQNTYTYNNNITPNVHSFHSKKLRDYNKHIPTTSLRNIHNVHTFHSHNSDIIIYTYIPTTKLRNVRNIYQLLQQWSATFINKALYNFRKGRLPFEARYFVPVALFLS